MYTLKKHEYSIWHTPKYCVHVVEYNVLTSIRHRSHILFLVVSPVLSSSSVCVSRTFPANSLVAPTFSLISPLKVDLGLNCCHPVTLSVLDLLLLLPSSDNGFCVRINCCHPVTVSSNPTEWRFDWLLASRLKFGSLVSSLKFESGSNCYHPVILVFLLFLLPSSDKLSFI